MAKYEEHRAAPMADVSSSPWVDGPTLATELPHRGIIDRLSDFLDGELSESECREVERHLGKCPECQEALASLKQTVELVRSLPLFGAPPGATQRIIQKVRQT